MWRSSRRRFLSNTASAAVLGPLPGEMFPSSLAVITPPKSSIQTGMGTALFRPFLVQSGRGPHLHNYAYASDVSWDPFRSNIAVNTGGRGGQIHGVFRFGAPTPLRDKLIRAEQSC